MNDVINVLRATLTKMSLVEVSDAAALFTLDAQPPPAASNRRFLLRGAAGRPKLLVADHFDLAADGLIWDGTFGSLGLVHILSDEGTESPVWIGKRINEAAYLRHLVLEAMPADQGQTSQTPYAVEIVFVSPAPQPSGDHPGESRLGDVLRDLTRDAAFLHGIGIGVWRAPFDDLSNARRALPWLLHATRLWYCPTAAPGAAPAAKPAQAPPAPARQLRTMKTRHYRVPGERTWTLDPKEALHVVHGYNGTGKSSLVEALELATTGRVQRIAEHPGALNYQLTITNDRAAISGERASIDLTFTDGSTHRTEVADDGAANPLASGTLAAAFRMHQSLGDQLSQSTPEMRARVLVESFFPQEYLRIQKLNNAQARLVQAKNALDPWLLARLIPEGGELTAHELARSLAWADETEVAWADVRARLLLDAKEREDIGCFLSASFHDTYAKEDRLPRESLKTRLAVLGQELDAKLDSAPRLVESLKDAQRFLSAYANASVETARPDHGDPTVQLNEWLEALALVDLLEKEHQVLSTLDAARARGHRFAAGDASGLASASVKSERADRERHLERLRKRRDDARQAVGRPPPSAPPTAAADSAPLMPIDYVNLAALDAVAAEGLFGDAYRSCEPPLSVAYRRAFTEHVVVEVRAADTGHTLQVGTIGCTAALTSNASSNEAALKMLIEIRAARAPASDAPSAARAAAKADPIAALSELRTAAAGVVAAGGELLAEFQRRIGSEGDLGPALNELMALFTPARWAYEDLVSDARLDTGSGRVEFNVGGGRPNAGAGPQPGVPAQLRWNTAELNACAIGLFLLCARNDRNPFGLILLDDPLQNMDELSVVAVARGMGRLMRLWKELDGGADGWRLALFLHSEEHVERVRREAPCAFYPLPWLSPSASLEDKQSIPTDASLLREGLQDLDRLIDVRLDAQLETPRR